jgi:hypothetical protein
MEQPNKIFVALRFLMWGTAALLLALPAIAMRAWPDAGVDWTGSDFVVMGMMLLVACGLVEVGIRLARNNFAYFAGTVFAVGAGFITVWVNLAVGMILSENNMENLVFLGVLAIALVGAVAARFEAPGMARAMLAAAAAQAAIGIVVGIAGIDQPYVAMLIAAFAVPWLLAAACFRAASRGALQLARA